MLYVLTKFLSLSSITLPMDKCKMLCYHVFTILTLSLGFFAA